MKTQKNVIKSELINYLLILPLLFFISCQNTNEVIDGDNVAYLSKSSKVTELMQITATNNKIHHDNSGLKKSSTTPTVYCTGFKYPITFEVSIGDNPILQQMTVYNDEELIEFFTVTLTENHLYYVFFPLTLLDANGEETIIDSVEDLEGSLQMALEICGDVDDSSDDNSDADNGDDSTSDNDSNNDDNNDSDNDDTTGDNDLNNDDNSGYEYCDSKMKKVSICHKGITICVSVNAIWGHLNQHEEDFLGTCN